HLARCALRTLSLHDALPISNIQFGDDVAVIGGGTMGLLHVILAKMKGARVILSEPLEERRKKAKELGCDDVINPAETDPVEEIKDRKSTRLNSSHVSISYAV